MNWKTGARAAICREALEQAEGFRESIPPADVLRMIQESEQTAPLIPESEVSDLHYIDVSASAYRYVKRGLDIILSVLGSLIVAVPLAVICLFIYIDEPGEVLFRQYRVGIHGKRFKTYKLRTMSLSAPKYLATGIIENPDQYITKIGRVLRALSIDELPQLLNVIRGDMSLIGPRPLIEAEREIHEMRMRFGVYNIRPGITGLAQINGRDKVTPTDKVRWDVKYLEQYGFKTDVKIMMKTILNVLRRSDIVEGHARDH